MQIESIHQFLQYTAENYYTEARGQWIFRGHSDVKYKLIPYVGRGKHTSKSRIKYEESLFKIFCREARGYLNNIPSTDWEWLALAQHYGLPTRLLDWTTNPLVALYFSVEASPDVDGELFALRATKKMSKLVLDGSPFSITKPQKYIPNIISHRIRAQEAIFIVCSELETPLDSDLRSDWKIDKFVVPAVKKDTIRYELYRIGIHASSLFPDIEGITSRLKWQHTAIPLKLV